MIINFMSQSWIVKALLSCWSLGANVLILVVLVDLVDCVRFKLNVALSHELIVGGNELPIAYACVHL